MTKEQGSRVIPLEPRCRRPQSYLRLRVPATSAAQIRQLGSLFELGGHTISPIDLSRTQDVAARTQIGGCRSWLEDVSGQPCSMFCPPLGRFHRRHLRMITEAGYEGLRTVEFLSLSWPRRAERLMIMPTTVQAYPHRGSSVPIPRVSHGVRA